MRERRWRGQTGERLSIHQRWLALGDYNKSSMPSIILIYINAFLQKNAWPRKGARWKNKWFQSQRHPLLGRETNPQCQVTIQSSRLSESTISFSKENIQYFINFNGSKGESYQLPIHLNMNPVTFTINKKGTEYSCFEWQLEIETDHVGCYMEPQYKN